MIARTFLHGSFVTLGWFTVLAYAQAPADPLSVYPVDRVTRPIDRGRTKPLRNQVPLSARPERERGGVDPNHVLKSVTLVLKRDERQEAALKAFADLVQQPDSPYYHQWLSNEAYAEHFGVSRNDLDQIVKWLQDEGMTVHTISPTRWRIGFSGTIAQMEATFHARIRSYTDVKSSVHFANSADPQIPDALSEVIEQVLGLDDFSPQSHARPAQLKGVTPKLDFNLEHYLGPSDFGVIYNQNTQYSGVGTTIGVVARCVPNIQVLQLWRDHFFDSKFFLPDIQSIKYHNGDPSLTYKDSAGNSKCDSSELGEVYLDAEWAGAVAHDARVLVYVGSDVDQSLQDAVDANKADVITMSFGSCESFFRASFYNRIWQEAAVKGISGFVSAGDSGAACDFDDLTDVGISNQCASIYVTCVGGTQFDGDVDTGNDYWNFNSGGLVLQWGLPRKYIPEVVWNHQDPDQTAPKGFGSTGGGFSGVYDKPGWQTQTMNSKRGIPDVSLTAASHHDGYVVCTETNCLEDPGFFCTLLASCDFNFSVIGGTSASAPAFASITSLLVQAYGRIGNPSPGLYYLATLPGLNVFHDITSGNNNTAKATGYSAGTGWDAASGLGSVDIGALVTAWPKTKSVNATLSPSTLSFPDTPAKTVSAPLSVTIKNAGSYSIHLIDFSFPAGADEFTFKNNGCSSATVAAGGSCTFSVTFQPQDGGSRTGKIHFVDDSSGTPYTYSVGGTGTPSVGRHVTSTTDVLANNANFCFAPPSSTSFANTTKFVFLYFYVFGAVKGDPFHVQFFKPDGSSYVSTDATAVNNGDNCFSVGVPIAGFSGSLAPGDWTAKVFWKTSTTPLFSLNFGITIGAPQVISAATTDTPPSLPPCKAPPNVGFFENTVSAISFYFEIDFASAGDVIHLNAITPDGRTYASVDNKLSTSGHTCFLANIPVAGKTASRLPGLWTLKVTWNQLTSPIATTQFTLAQPAGSGAHQWLSIGVNPSQTIQFPGGGSQRSSFTEFVCRGVPPGGGTHPGKYVPALKTCAIEYAGAEVGLTDFELLTDFSGVWVPAARGSVPSGALPAGTESGRNFFVCRVFTSLGTMEIGKIRDDFNACNYALNGAGLTSSNYEVLVNPWTPQEGNAALTNKAIRIGSEMAPTSSANYACRTAWPNGLAIGWLDKGLCRIGTGDSGAQFSRFEVLTTNLTDSVWLPASAGTVPAGSFLAGRDGAGTPRYLCRAQSIGSVADRQGQVEGVTRAGQLIPGVGCQIQIGFASSLDQQQTVPNYEVLASTPPIPAGPFKIRTKSTGKAWSEGVDLAINTSAQPDDSSVRYTFVREAGGGYRLSVNGGELYENSSQQLSSAAHPASDYGIFFFEQQGDIGSYRVRTKGDNLYLAEGKDGVISTRTQVDDDTARVFLEPTNTIATSPKVSLIPGRLTFTDQGTGTQSESQSVTLSNTGSGTLNIKTIATTGDFSQSNDCGAAISRGANCTIKVAFSPTAAGARTGNLTVTDDAAGSPHSVTLDGNGVPGQPPAISLSVNSLTFASQNVGSTSAAQTVKLTNSGKGPLNIKSMVASGDYKQTNDCGSVLNPSLTCTVTVTFSPTAVGKRDGSVTITDDAPGSPHAISLTGTGAAPPASGVSFDPSRLTFADQAVGSRSAAQSIKLTSSGTGPLSIKNIVATGDFIQSNDCSVLLNPGSSCAISVTFFATTTGRREGAITVTDDAPGSPHVITLTGNGVASSGTGSLPASSHTYDLTKSFSDQQGGPALTANGGVISAAGDTFTAGHGPSGAILGSPGSYTIAMRVAFDSASGFVKILDFGNLTSDNGLYYNDGRLNFYPYETANIGPVAARSSHVIVMTRDASTGIVRLYLDGAQAGGDIADGGGVGVLAAQAPLFFFTDDNTTGGEASAGVATFIQIWDAALTPSQVALIKDPGVATTSAGRLGLSDTSLAFADQIVSVISPTKAINVINTGTGPLSIKSFAASGDFLQFNDCPAVLNPIDSCTLTVAFFPLAAGKRDGAVTITTDAPGSPHVITLTGNGVTQGGGGSLPASAHTYDLTKSFSDQQGGPALTANGGVISAAGDTFTAGHGPSGALLGNSGTYTIAMRVSFDTVADVVKILDFSNLNSDNGLYYSGGRLIFYPTPGQVTNTIPVADRTLHLVVITRDASTAIVRLFLDGAQVGGDIVDSTPIGVLAQGAPLAFFTDDKTTGGSEASGGVATFIQTWDVALTPIQVISIRPPA